MTTTEQLLLSLLISIVVLFVAAAIYQHGK